MTTRPTPTDEADKKRWEITGVPHRMLTGNWKRDAEKMMASFFDPDVEATFRCVDTSHNALKSYSVQLNTLYKESPAVEVDGDPDLEALRLDDLWPQQQNTGLLVLGCNEALVRVDYEDGVGITYRTVPADTVARVVMNPATGAIEALEEQRKRKRTKDDGTVETVWTWETWDIRDPSAPVFKIEQQDGEGKRSEVTAEHMPDGWTEGDYPYSDDGPIMPYALYHRRVGHHTWAPMENSELVEGTLRCAAYWSMWGAGLRDSSYPIRVLINGKLNGTTTEQGKQEKLTISPMHIQTITDISGNARIDQFPAGIEPNSFAAAIGAYAQQLAIHAGLNPADVALSSSGASGFALEVKETGKRELQAQLVPSFRRSDQILIATAARLANAYEDGVSGLPVEPQAYRIEYHRIGKTAGERKAEADADAVEVEAGYRHPAEGWMSRHPGTTQEDAEEQMLQAAAFRARLAAVTSGERFTFQDDVSPPEPEEPTEPEEPEEEPTEDTTTPEVTDE